MTVVMVMAVIAVTVSVFALVVTALPGIPMRVAVATASLVVVVGRLAHGCLPLSGW
ncbi:hypothetical protein [Streptantibioticus ferralitis]|uniref:hypothetical protein n=1 Tax=Streptantibioticus ferralitis TaxID=236510 RepID=UPI0026E58694